MTCAKFGMNRREKFAKPRKLCNDFSVLGVGKFVIVVILVGSHLYAIGQDDKTWKFELDASPLTFPES